MRETLGRLSSNRLARAFENIKKERKGVVLFFYLRLRMISAAAAARAMMMTAPMAR